MGNFSCSCCRLLTFYKVSKKHFINTICNCQMVWIQIMPDMLSGLIWVQTVCKDNQQMTTFACFVIFHVFIVVCFFSKLAFSKNASRNQSVRKFESRSGPTFWPDLEPICLKGLSANNYLCILCNFVCFYIFVC